MAKKKTAPGKRSKRSAVQSFFRGLYIVVFAFSLVIVIGFAALHFIAPTVDSQIVIEPPSDPPVTRPPEAAPSAVPASEEPEPTSQGTVLNRRDGVFTCLLVGSADIGGTDTIMLGVFDTGAKTASLVSIPRDTVVHVDGKDRKINTVQGVGGVSLLMETVSHMLALPVDRYVEVDTYAFKAIVEKIGGVYFDVPVDMNYDDPLQNLHIHISKGYQLLNGNDALGVMRCRNCYPNADIGRGQTQRKFLAALVKQTITLSNVTKVTDLINVLNTYVESDMPLSDMVWFATQAIGMDLDTDLSSAVLPGDWVSPYYELDDEAVLELVNGLDVYEEEVPAWALDIRHP